jgi:hypothetical protein
MLQAGVAAAEADLGAVLTANCASGQVCFQVGEPPRAEVGVNAGTFYGDTSGRAADGTYRGGAACWVYLYEDATGWHFNSVRCAQATGSTPGIQSLIWVAVGSCANVRDGPSLTSKVLDCLARKTLVDVDSAPVYADGHIWWHLSDRGWMAHNFLIAPKPYGSSVTDWS